MTTSKDLKEALAKVPADCFLPHEATAVLAFACAAEQAAQGWGASQDDKTLFTLARLLPPALEAAEKADELDRKAKGLQLENGRLKKQVARKQEEIEDLRCKLSTAEEQLALTKENFDALQTAHDSALERIDGLLAERVPDSSEQQDRPDSSADAAA